MLEPILENAKFVSKTFDKDIFQYTFEKDGYRYLYFCNINGASMLLSSSGEVSYYSANKLYDTFGATSFYPTNNAITIKRIF